MLIKKKKKHIYFNKFMGFYLRKCLQRKEVTVLEGTQLPIRNSLAVAGVLSD